MSAPAGDLASDSSGSMVVFTFLPSISSSRSEVSVQHVQGTVRRDTDSRGDDDTLACASVRQSPERVARQAPCAFVVRAEYEVDKASARA